MDHGNLPAWLTVSLGSPPQCWSHSSHSLLWQSQCTLCTETSGTDAAGISRRSQRNSRAGQSICSSTRTCSRPGEHWGASPWQRFSGDALEDVFVALKILQYIQKALKINSEAKLWPRDHVGPVKLVNLTLSQIWNCINKPYQGFSFPAFRHFLQRWWRWWWQWWWWDPEK